MPVTNTHGHGRHVAYIGTSIAPPASGPGTENFPLEALHEQQGIVDSDARRRNARGSDPSYSDDGQAAIGVSPRSSVLPVTNVADKKAFTPPRIKRLSPSITGSGHSEGIRHNGSQDARPDAFSRVHPICRDTDPDTPVDRVPCMKDEFCPGKDCLTQRDLSTSRFTWLNCTIIFICSVSTALSALFVVLASRGQRYGEYIGNNPEATLSISAAILWTSVAAKTIELTFVTGFVAFLGQVLSRRILVKGNGRGVTLSELTIWRWVVQPGTLVAQPEIARYAGLSALGILTLLSTVLSTLYVTAATALVQPISQQSDWRVKAMIGSVQTDFANIQYIKQLCPTPTQDKEEGASTCMQIDNAGKSLYNLAQYLATWNDIVKASDGLSTSQEHRPTWIGIPYVNTTVVPQWVNVIDTAEVSRRYQRVINNVSLALPHVGVSNAVRDKRNIMPQSETFDSIEAYSLWASVPSPVMNVLCVHMNRTELEPIVYDAWPNDDVVNMTSWNVLPGIRDKATTVNKTVVDELFGWNSDSNTIDYPPVFGRYPMPFNTVLNHTSFSWGRRAIYLLGQGGRIENGTDLTDVYPLCKLQVDITTRCSTLHSVSISGTKAEALCEDRASDMEYTKHIAEELFSGAPGLANWRDVGFDWANSLSLGMGMMDGNFSQSRTLMMLLLQPGNPDLASFQVELNRQLPSLAETLAITASDTLLASLQGAPFVEYWNYTHPMLDEPQTQYFKAKIQSREYASGGVDNASKGWLVILISTFFVNVVVLVYFIQQPGLVTDISQPPQLFALAINSPPTRAFAGSCGGGPQGKDYKLDWFINHEGGHISIEPGLGRDSRSIAESDLDRDPAHQNANPAGNGLASTVSAVFGYMKLNSKLRFRGLRRRNPVSGTEPLRPSRVSESVLSLGSQYKLGDIETQTQ
ncbi:hypothetical protein G6011_06724 [Alternaria panax]|uniref:Uncharacterized protein n=1 Tax=Alternaria panax TaxID=48097 RepID=A0AAD4FJY1_9PLEO|nr:hypothetical protein G6011_06724 [Alternaria panax]